MYYLHVEIRSDKDPDDLAEERQAVEDAHAANPSIGYVTPDPTTQMLLIRVESESLYDIVAIAKALHRTTKEWL